MLICSVLGNSVHDFSHLHLLISQNTSVGDLFSGTLQEPPPPLFPELYFICLYS